MKTIIATALAATLVLGACSSETPEDAEPNAELPGGEADAATSLGAGDLTSTAGAGATTGAMDGGSVAEDGDPITDDLSDADAGAGGPADRLENAGVDTSGAAPTPVE